jgi:hypothetical protein
MTEFPLRSVQGSSKSRFLPEELSSAYWGGSCSVGTIQVQTQVVYVIKQSSAIPLWWFLICWLCRNHRCQHGAYILLWIRDLWNGFKDISASSKDKFHAGVSYYVTNQKQQLMEEMCTEFDAMCRDRERHMQFWSSWCTICRLQAEMVVGQLSWLREEDESLSLSPPLDSWCIIVL